MAGKATQTQKNAAKMVKDFHERISPSNHLTESEKAEWNKIVGSCDPLHFQEDDRLLLDRLCILLVRMRIIEHAVKHEGLITDAGKISPHYTLLSQLETKLVTLCVKLNLSPISRNDVGTKATPKPKVKSEVANLREFDD